MKQRDVQRLWALVGRLSGAQRQELIGKLQAQAAASQSVELLDTARSQRRGRRHCTGERITRNGTADRQPRYKCRACGKTFNALTCTPLARLRHDGKWLEQTRVLAHGLTVHRAAECLSLAAGTVCRWRHRFLARSSTTSM